MLWQVLLLESLCVHLVVVLDHAKLGCIDGLEGDLSFGEGRFDGKHVNDELKELLRHKLLLF